jgi:NADH-quinone oxidoreductase subunit F
MAAVQTNIIGNCLCVLGDSMAMPVGSMIQKFRPEFEQHIERAREAADRLSVELGVAAAPADAAA